MKIIDKNASVEIEDILPGEIFENAFGVYLKIVPFCNSNDDECNCVDLSTNNVHYMNGEAKIIKGAFVVGER